MSGKTSFRKSRSIFISYRRDDSSSNSGRIYDRLIQEFGHEAIFKDVDTIPSGVDFHEHIEQQISNCKILLAIIGKSWATNSRLQNHDDFVRIEIEHGLTARDIIVVPILVDHAIMPMPEQLPQSLKEITRLNAVKARPDPDFHKDMDKLIDELVKIIGPPESFNRRQSEIVPYRVAGEEISEPKELVRVFIKNWNLGVTQFKRGFVTNWINEHYKNQGITGQLLDISDEFLELDDSQKLSLALMAMDRDLPLFIKGTEISPEWMASNPVESVKILNSPLIKWMQKLNLGKDYLNIKLFLNRGQTQIQNMEMPANIEMIDELLLLYSFSPDELNNRFDQFCTTFHYSTNIKADAILNKREFNLYDKVALLACDCSIFLTKDQLRMKESKKYIKTFNLPIDWDLAENLIHSNNWNEVEPHWRKALDNPIPELANHPKLGKAFSEIQPDILDGITLATAHSFLVNRVNSPPSHGELLYTGTKVTSSQTAYNKRNTSRTLLVSAVAILMILSGIAFWPKPKPRGNQPNPRK